MWKRGIEVRRDIGVVMLRQAARRAQTGRVAARLLGIANILDGMERGAAARQAGMTRQTLRDWVLRFNAQGIAGLSNRPKGHAKRSLTPAQETALEALVLKGPEGTLVRWRRVDLRDVIKARFGVDYHERSVGKILHRLGFSRVSARPIHPETDQQAQMDFKKTLPPRSRLFCPSTPAAAPSNSGSKTKRGLVRKAH